MNANTPKPAELLEAAKQALASAENALSNYLGGDSLARALADLEPVRDAISSAEVGS